jgi:hypothetical protein
MTKLTLRKVLVGRDGLRAGWGAPAGARRLGRAGESYHVPRELHVPGRLGKAGDGSLKQAKDEFAKLQESAEAS